MADTYLIPVARVARILGWTTRRTRRWLQHEGALVLVGPRYYYTTLRRLRRAFPDIVEDERLARRL